MTNHYHLLVETIEGNLSRGMRQLNGTYTQTFNRRYHESGHLYQGRYKAILVEKETYLLELTRYVEYQGVSQLDILEITISIEMLRTKNKDLFA